MELTAENVNAVARECLFDEGEIPAGTQDEQQAWVKENGSVAEGIMVTFAFNKERIERRRDDIRSMVAQTPSEFHRGGGGGMSFLNLCVRADGEHWAEHPTMELLVCLAKAAGVGGYLMPREMWQFMPGGMPYVQFVTD